MRCDEGKLTCRFVTIQKSDIYVQFNGVVCQSHAGSHWMISTWFYVVGNRYADMMAKIEEKNPRGLTVCM